MDANSEFPFLDNPQENITWASVPSGVHVVKVLFYEYREKTEVPFILTIILKHGDVYVYEGTVNYDNKRMTEIVKFELVDGKLLFSPL